MTTPQPREDELKVRNVEVPGPRDMQGERETNATPADQEPEEV
jgi:hypothetical protein